MEKLLESFEIPAGPLHEYEQLIASARQRFARSTGIRGMLATQTDARTMAAFLLHFSALSVPITEPVEGWIRRASDRCNSMGLTDIGRALGNHAKAEAGHHRYHQEDFENLVRFWNARWIPRVDASAILAHRLTSGGEKYVRVHEETIAGTAPYCQFAIEYEIELLPVRYGPRFVENSVRLLGQEILQCMSFATSHIEFDVGHTKFNARFLERLIAEAPVRLPMLVRAGTAALDAFSEHLDECLMLAKSFGMRQ